MIEKLKGITDRGELKKEIVEMIDNMDYTENKNKNTSSSFIITSELGGFNTEDEKTLDYIKDNHMDILNEMFEEDEKDENRRY